MTDHPDPDRRTDGGADRSDQGRDEASLEEQLQDELEVAGDPLMTVQETADLLGVTAGDLAQMRVHGTGPAWGTFTTRVVRYDRDEVLHWAHTHPQPD